MSVFVGNWDFYAYFYTFLCLPAQVGGHFLQSVIVFSAGRVSDPDSKNMYFCLFVVRQGQELALLPQLLSFHDMQCIIIIDILTKFEI